MNALLKNKGVSLVITWNGGNTITIPAGRAETSSINDHIVMRSNFTGANLLLNLQGGEQHNKD